MEEKIQKFNNNFIKNLKLERKSRNLTQKQVADLMGIKMQSYSAYESGISMPSVENLLKLVCLFNLSLDDLFEI